MMLNRVVTATALAVGGYFLSKQMGKKGRMDDSASVEETIEVNVPLRTAYNQWTQFEDFPSFMESVKEVRQMDDRHLHWKASIAGKDKEWDAEIIDQVPDRRIAWRSVGGVHNDGIVSFQKLSNDHTRITLKMSYEPEGPAEQLGDALGAVRMEARSNLQRFKEKIEAQGKETGAWRGQITQH